MLVQSKVEMNPTAESYRQQLQAIPSTFMSQLKSAWYAMHTSTPFSTMQESSGTTIAPVVDSSAGGGGTMGELVGSGGGGTMGALVGFIVGEAVVGDTVGVVATDAGSMSMVRRAASD